MNPFNIITFNADGTPNNGRNRRAGVNLQQQLRTQLQSQSQPRPQVQVQEQQPEQYQQQQYHYQEQEQEQESHHYQEEEEDELLPNDSNERTVREDSEDSFSWSTFGSKLFLKLVREENTHYRIKNVDNNIKSRIWSSLFDKFREQTEYRQLTAAFKENITSAKCAAKYNRLLKHYKQLVNGVTGNSGHGAAANPR